MPLKLLQTKGANWTKAEIDGYPSRGRTVRASTRHVNIAVNSFLRLQYVPCCTKCNSYE